MTEPLSFVVAGLDKPVDILVDEWGVPHIYAESTHDVFLAQGFNAARDRLFQLDLWRRQGLGLMAEAFGPDYVERDRAARLFLYRGDMHAEWLAYGSATKAIVTAFVAGINAFIQLCESDREFLPLEFGLLHYAPGAWAPEDVARIRSNALGYNLENEVARALTLRDYGPDLEEIRHVREPDHPLIVPDGLDLSVLSEQVLDTYRLATASPRLGAGTPDASAPAPPEGSNNWVLGPTMTTTGRPILANDPHRATTLPSLRYIAHLSAPGLDVIGAGEPALPGVSIGHNGHVAFGLTIFAIDQEDLYCYKTHDDDPDQYWYDGRWEPMVTRVESVPVADGPDRTVTLQWTRHGPVVHKDDDAHTAFALRTVWLEPGTAPYLGSVEYMTARTCDEFATAMNRWTTPGENQVFADSSGAIGWQPAGLVPRRPTWDGTMPVPGDGRYEWDGFYDTDQLPAERMPARGWISTANEMNLPADYPNDVRTITYDWSQRYRKARIDEVLTGADTFSVEDCVRLQSDFVNVAARQIIALLGDLGVADEPASVGIALLRDWDCDEDASSAAAALYEIWHRRHLRPALFRSVLANKGLSEDEAAAAMRRLIPKEALSGDMRPDLFILDHRRLLDASGHGGDADEALKSLMVASLADAVREANELMGPRIDDWSWGRLHRAVLHHPAEQLLPDDTTWTTLGPVPRGGSGNTVGNTNADHSFTQTAGATFRIVIDVGEWDNSVAMNAPGQSGDPRSAHYDDLLVPWADDGCFPLLYTAEKVREHTDQKIVLIPAPRPGAPADATGRSQAGRTAHQ